jgi:hypothetical protein
MEIIFIVGLMVLIYVVPEILRGQRKTEYQYPEIPQTKPKYEGGKKHLPHIPPTVSEHAVKPFVKKDLAMSPVVEVPNFLEERQAANNAAWINGIIMAEVLQPPRARRPIFYHKK